MRTLLVIILLLLELGCVAQNPERGRPIDTQDTSAPWGQVNFPENSPESPWNE